MRCDVASTVLLSLVPLLDVVHAVPITPSAPEAQRLAEQMRAKGISEKDISAHLSSVEADTPDSSSVGMRIQSLFTTPLQVGERDTLGDISPSSIQAPEILPRVAAPNSIAEQISAAIDAALNGRHERREFAYEGKESEMRRPFGMRHWNEKGYTWV